MPLIGSPRQCGLYCGAEIGIGEARTAQLQPGGDALEKSRALLHRHAAAAVMTI
jgi:hypothetical protein